MTAQIIDGKAISQKVRDEVKANVAAFVARHGRAPGLDVVLVGENAASLSYTKNKEKMAKEAGMNGILAKPVDPDALFETLLKWLPVTVA